MTAAEAVEYTNTVLLFVKLFLRTTANVVSCFAKAFDEQYSETASADALRSSVKGFSSTDVSPRG